jgi:putative spermidine/putrescine transport system permease protein
MRSREKPLPQPLPGAERGAGQNPLPRREGAGGGLSPRTTRTYSTRRRRPVVWLLLLPSLAVIALFLVGGVGFAFVQSLGLFPLLGERELTLRHYSDVLHDPDLLAAVHVSLRISAGSTGIALIIGTGMALLLRRRLRGDGILRVLFQLPLPIPHLIGAVGITFLVTQSGLVARLLNAVGLLGDRSQFPLLVGDRFGIGIILVYVWKEVPFITLLLLAALAGIGDQPEEAARTLGASAWQRFRHVLLPLLLPAMLSASLIVFAFTFGAFEVPYVMGRTYPQALPVWAYERFNDVDLNQRPEALAVSVVIALLAAIVIVAYGALSRRILARGW